VTDSFEGGVTVTVPADTRYIKTIRLAVSGVASLGSFSIDAIDDMKVAVDEMCSTLLEVGDGSALSISVSTPRRDTLRIVGHVPVGEGSPVDEARAELSTRILDVMTDDHGFGVTDGTASFWCERSVDPAAAE